MVTLCINTQSSPIRQLREISSETNSDITSLENLKEGLDFQYNAGGVTRMIHPMISHCVNSNIFSKVDWVALAGSNQFEIDMGEYTLHGVSLPEKTLNRYAEHKEAIWESMHGKKARFTRTNFHAYLEYNRKVADKINQLNTSREFDVLYVHDFQQLPQAKMLGNFAPTLFRWHIPFYEKFCSNLMREILCNFLDQYTSVIVSTERYADELRKIGFRGQLRHCYPFVDDRSLIRHPEGELRSFREKWGISEDDNVILCVSRMTPSKNQAVIIRAMKKILRSLPNTKLILVGNGSFSNSNNGGLGLSKSMAWINHLRSLISSNGLDGHVILTGYLDTKDLLKAFEICDLFILPSLVEGFGLVVIEAWHYKKPVIVSNGSGVAERVVEGENGYTFNPRKPRDLAENVIAVLTNPSLAYRMGENGYLVANEHNLNNGFKNEISIIENAIELWQTSRPLDTKIDFAEI